MNLREWKISQKTKHREALKEAHIAGIEVLESSMFSAEEIQELCEEAEVEAFCEMMEDWEELSLDDDLLTESSSPEDSYEFIPSSAGRYTDVEIEVDLDSFSVSEDALERIKDTFFAESYEVIVEGNLAKIVFKRSKGEVFKKKKCGKGMRLVGNKCLPQTGTQKSAERRRGIKLKRAFRAMGAGKKKKAQIKKKITDRRIRGRSRNLANTVN